MAKKNNLVGGAKAKISLILIAGMAAGWGIYGGSPEQCQKAERDGGKSRGIYTGQAVYTGS